MLKCFQWCLPFKIFECVGRGRCKTTVYRTKSILDFCKSLPNFKTYVFKYLISFLFHVLDIYFNIMFF